MCQLSHKIFSFFFIIIFLNVIGCAVETCGCDEPDTHFVYQNQGENPVQVNSYK